MLLSNLADAAQVMLADSGATTWSQSTIELWVLEGIRDYSIHVKRHVQEQILLPAYSNSFPAPLTCHDIISISRELFDDGNTKYLTRFNRFDPRFADSDDYFDWAPSHDQFTPGTVYLSLTSGAADWLELTYHGLYFLYDTSPANPTILVPDQDVGVILQYVYWRALTERFANAILQAVPGADPNFTADYWGARAATLIEAATAAREAYDAGITAIVASRNLARGAS